MGPTVALMVLTVLLLSQQLSPCESLRVAAFNLQRFGLKKLQSKPFLEQALPMVQIDAWLDCVEIAPNIVIYS